MRVAGIFILAASAAFGQPFFPSIYNAAFRGAGIAPGSTIEIDSRQQSPPASGAMVTFASTAADVTMTGGALPSPFCCRIWAIVPEEMPPGETIVRVSIPGEPPASARIEIVPLAPALFSENRLGFGPASALQYGDYGPYAVKLTNPVLPGQFVALYGTGLGDAAVEDVLVDVAGTLIPATFAGREISPGVDQINFRMPEDPFLGCYVPVSLHVRGVVSNQVTLAINATPGACAHPLGLSYDNMRTLDQGGTVLLGSLDLRFPSGTAWSSPGVEIIVPDLGTTASLIRADADLTALIAQVQMPEQQYFSCTAYHHVPAFLYPSPPDADAGARLGLTDPHGRVYRSNLLVPYRWDVPPIPGPWLFSAPGGGDIHGFQQAFTLPPPLRDLNAGLLTTYPRDQEAILTWNPQGYGPGDVLLATLRDGDGDGAAEVVCRVHAADGRLTIPTDLLASLPSGLGTLSLSVTAYPASRVFFDLPLTSGGTAPAVINYVLMDLRTVRIR